MRLGEALGLQWISIHAPRAGGDKRTNRIGGERLISIHAPRAGGDGIGLK